MSAIIQIVIISVSLAMDAFSVSIAGGISTPKAKISQAIKIASFFGIFQAVMPLIGWAIGDVLKGFITSIDHWVAFFLLGFIGVKMIQESLQNEKDEKRNILKTKMLIILSIATSIDALIVCITLSLLQLPFIVSITTIGVITFILCFLGFIFGKRIGILFGKKIEIAGGIALILIGLKILIDHLTQI